MKLKKFILAMGLIVTVAFACFAESWTITEDSCKNCKITDTKQKCGECGGPMMPDKGKKIEVDDEDYYLLAITYICKECKHTCTAIKKIVS